MQPLDPGAVLFDGRFAIVRLIAHGGQATTYEGIDKREGQRVAIKRFVVRGASSWKDVELAEREARVLSSLSHRGIPRHVAHFEENGELFLVTEYIDGQTLDALSKGSPTNREGSALERDSQSTQAPSRLSQADVVSYLFAVAELLDYLHSKSPPIIHRDIKPKNVIRRTDGSFVLVDFGSVRERLKPEGGSTVVGTFGYMAPEQFQGRALPATDTYAAAATALALLTGRDPDQLPHQGLRLDVDKALGTTVSSELKRVLKSALEPDPDRRAQRLSQLLVNSTLRHETNSKERQPQSRARTTTSDSQSRPSPNNEPNFDQAPFSTHGYQRARSPREERLASEREARRAQEYAAREEHRVREQSAYEARRDYEHASREERRAYKRAARRQRREARRGFEDAFGRGPNIDLRSPLRHALRDRDVRRFLSIPAVALILTMLLVLARTALWFVLGIALPLLLVVLHRMFGLPVLDEARRSRHIARQMRSQMREVTATLREGNLHEPQSIDERPEQEPRPDVRFRVESTVPHNSRESKGDFARQFDEEAYELETQLEEAIEKMGRK